MLDKANLGEVEVLKLLAKRAASEPICVTEMQGMLAAQGHDMLMSAADLDSFVDRADFEALQLQAPGPHKKGTADILGTRPYIRESHSEISTRVPPFCITQPARSRAQVGPCAPGHRSDGPHAQHTRGRLRQGHHHGAGVQCVRDPLRGPDPGRRARLGC